MTLMHKRHVYRDHRPVVVFDNSEVKQLKVAQKDTKAWKVARGLLYLYGARSLLLVAGENDRVCLGITSAECSPKHYFVKIHVLSGGLNLC